MCDLLVLGLIGWRVAVMCRTRGRRAWPWVVALVLSWFTGMGVGGLAGYALAWALIPDVPQGDALGVVVGCLVGVVAGVTFVVGTVHFLPARPPGWGDDDYFIEDDGWDRPNPQAGGG